MIDTVIFDIGNVLVEFIPSKYVKLFTDNEETAIMLIEATFQHWMWQELDRGTVTEEESVRKMMEDAPELAYLINKMFAWDWVWWILKPMEQSMAFLRELKERGFKLYMLSNYHERTFKYIIEQNEEFSLFDGGVISWEIRANKPEPEMYKCLLEKYDLRPAECVFIDDMQANLDGASKFGINTILFEDINQVRKDFEILEIFNKI